MRDRKNPSFYEAIAADPHLELNARDRLIYTEDMNRKLSRLMLPIVRVIFLSGIWLVRFIKRYLPFDIRSHKLLTKLGVWYMKDMTSPQALEYIIKHFQIESALINFVADNCSSSAVQRVDLIPTHVSQLGDVDGLNAIMLHDFNMYNHIIDTGSDPTVDVKTQRPLDQLNFSALELPPIDHEPERKRILNLDIETSGYVMGFFLALFLTDEEMERAALSLQLDESLMTSLANLTGDDFFIKLCPMKFTNFLRYHYDVVQELRFHMMTLDYAYHRLKKLSEQATS